MILLNNTDRPIAIEGTGIAPIPSRGMATLSTEQEKALRKNKTAMMLIDKGILRTGEPKGEPEMVNTVKATMDSAKTSAPVTQGTVTTGDGKRAAAISTEVVSLQGVELKDE